MQVSIQKKPLEFFKKVVKLFSRISGEIFMLCNENYMVLKVLDMTETIVLSAKFDSTFFKSFVFHQMKNAENNWNILLMPAKFVLIALRSIHLMKDFDISFDSNDEPERMLLNFTVENTGTIEHNTILLDIVQIEHAADPDILISSLTHTNTIRFDPNIILQYINHLMRDIDEIELEINKDSFIVKNFNDEHERPGHVTINFEIKLYIAQFAVYDVKEDTTLVLKSHVFMNMLRFAASTGCPVILSYSEPNKPLQMSIKHMSVSIDLVEATIRKEGEQRFRKRMARKLTNVLVNRSRAVATRRVDNGAAEIPPQWQNTEYNRTNEAPIIEQPIKVVQKQLGTRPQKKNAFQFRIPAKFAKDLKNVFASSSEDEAEMPQQVQMDASRNRNNEKEQSGGRAAQAKVASQASVAANGNELDVYERYEAFVPRTSAIIATVENTQCDINVTRQKQLTNSQHDENLEAEALMSEQIDGFQTFLTVATVYDEEMGAHESMSVARNSNEVSTAKRQKTIDDREAPIPEVHQVHEVPDADVDKTADMRGNSDTRLSTKRKSTDVPDHVKLEPISCPLEEKRRRMCITYDTMSMISDNEEPTVSKIIPSHMTEDSPIRHVDEALSNSSTQSSPEIYINESQSPLASLDGDICDEDDGEIATFDGIVCTQFSKEGLLVDGKNDYKDAVPKKLRRLL